VPTVAKKHLSATFLIPTTHNTPVSTFRNNQQYAFIKCGLKSVPATMGRIICRDRWEWGSSSVRMGKDGEKPLIGWAGMWMNRRRDGWG